MRRLTGEIVALKNTYGFIRDEHDNFRWFHSKYLKGVSFGMLNIGDRVEFTPFIGPRGRRAEDIRVIPSLNRVSMGIGFPHSAVDVTRG